MSKTNIQTSGGDTINTKVFYIRSQDGYNFGKNVDGETITTDFEITLDAPIRCEPHQVIYGSLNDIQIPWSWFSTDRTNNQFVVMMQFNGGMGTTGWGPYTTNGSTYVQRYVLTADQFPYDPLRPTTETIRASTNPPRAGLLPTYALHSNIPPGGLGNTFCCQDCREIPKANYTPATFALQIQTMLNRPWNEGGFGNVGFNMTAAPTNQFHIDYNQATNSLYIGLQYTDTGLASVGGANVLAPRVYFIWNDIILPNGTGGYYTPPTGEVIGDPQGIPGFLFPSSSTTPAITIITDPDAGVAGTGVPALALQPFNILAPRDNAFSQMGFGPRGNIQSIPDPRDSSLYKRPTNWMMEGQVGGVVAVVVGPNLDGRDYWYWTGYTPYTPPQGSNLTIYRNPALFPNGFQMWSAAAPTNLDSQFFYTPAVMDWYGERHRAIYVRTSMTSARSHSSRINNRSDILAKVPVQQITDTHAEDIHNNDMVTYGKEENMGVLLDKKSIQSMRIHLTDGDGIPIDLNGLDWTLSIRFDIGWKPSYVMWNGGRRSGDNPDAVWTDPQAAAHQRILLMREYDAWRSSQKPVPPPEEKRDRSKEEGNKPASLTAEREERKEAAQRGWITERPLEEEEARHQVGLT